jgi:nitrogen-specific signal transduction histidine kinase
LPVICVMREKKQESRSTERQAAKENREEVALRNLFHDTRNPLQVIMSSVSLLEENPPPKEQKTLYKAILSNSLKIDRALNTFANQTGSKKY